MPITFNCPCGKALRVADEHAGRRVKCPACQAVGTVPAPEPEPQFEVVEDPREQLVSPPPAPRPVAKPVVDDEDEDGRGYSVANTSRADEDEEPRAKKKPDFRKGSGRPARDDDEDEEYDRPRKKKGKKRRAADEFEGPAPGVDAGKKVMYVVGGLLLLAIGAALAIFGWQAEGRGATRALVLGVCLVISAFGTMFKGVTGNFDDDDE